MKRSASARCLASLSSSPSAPPSCTARVHRAYRIVIDSPWQTSASASQTSASASRVRNCYHEARVLEDMRTEQCYNTISHGDVSVTMEVHGYRPSPAQRMYVLLVASFFLHVVMRRVDHAWYEACAWQTCAATNPFSPTRVDRCVDCMYALVFAWVLTQSYHS